MLYSQKKFNILQLFFWVYYMKACYETYHSETYFIGNVNGCVCI